MNRRTYIALFSAAVAAVVVGGSQKGFAQALTWDSSGSAGSGTPVDGPGTWDLTTPNWTDGTANVVWPNDSTNPTTPVYSANFGNATNTPSSTPIANEISLGAPIEVQDINLGTGSDGSVYYIDDGQGGSIQIDGNVTKSTAQGQLEFLMFASQVTLSAGNHTFAINDSPGAVPELTMNTGITGAGSVTLDNSQFASGSYGTLVFAQSNSYTGGTTITSGLLVTSKSDSLGSGPVAIGSLGTLSIGGVGSGGVGSATINNAITITRNTYTGGTNGDFGKNPDALVSGNTGNASAVITFPNLLIDSTDARIAADTSTILLPNALTAAADVNGSAEADFDGDFSGFVDLTADNTAFGSAGNIIGVRGGVELNVSNESELGGATSKLALVSGFIHPTGDLASGAFMTNFGGHVIVNNTVGTGLDLDSGNTFTVNGLSGAGVGERGLGTLDFQGTNTFTGTQYFDGGMLPDGVTRGGVIDYQAGSSTTQVGLRVRSATVDIEGAVNVSGTYTSIGADSTGTFNPVSGQGVPDMAIINMSGNGSILETSGDDFNVSDNANTSGTIIMHDNASLTVAGHLYLGKNTGATGTIYMYDNSTLSSNNQVFVGQNNGTGVFNQYGGSVNLTNGGNFTFVVSDGRNGTGSGTYNLYGGSLTSAGEIYVGEGAHGNGTWNQTGGTVNFSNWFVVGRESALGTVNLSGGTITKTGTVGADTGGNISIGEGSANVCTVNITGTGVFTENAGEFYVGNNSGVGVVNIGTSTGALTNADSTASLTANNWFAVGRSGASTGTVNLYDGTLTQATANWFDISGDGGSSTGIVNVYGGTLNALQMYLGENGSGHATLNINGGNVNVTNNSIFANGNSVTGTLNLNGGTLTAFGFQAHNGGGTGAATFVFNGGTLAASTNNTTAFIGAQVKSVVSAGGALINSMGHLVTITSALTHDSSLSGADGGLTKLGAGTLTLSGAETYTGPTTISAGTLQYTGNNNETLSSLSIANGAALDLSGGQTVTVTTGLSGYLTDIQAAYDKGAWDGTSAVSPIITSAYAATNHAVGIGYSTSGGALTLRLTYLGDVDLNGAATYADILAMTPMSSGGTWATGDFNYDGAVNADDFALAQLGALKSAGANITALVPEPASMAFLVLPALLGLAPRRTRKRGN